MQDRSRRSQKGIDRVHAWPRKYARTIAMSRAGSSAGRTGPVGTLAPLCMSVGVGVGVGMGMGMGPVGTEYTTPRAHSASHLRFSSASHLRST